MVASSQDNSTEVVFDGRNTQESHSFKCILTQEALEIYMQPLLMCYVNLNKIPPLPNVPMLSHPRFCAVLWHDVGAARCGK